MPVTGGEIIANCLGFSSSAIGVVAMLGSQVVDLLVGRVTFALGESTDAYVDEFEGFVLGVAALAAGIVGALAYWAGLAG